MFASHWIDPPRTGLGLSASHPSRPLPRPRWRAPMLPRRNERRATTLTRRSSATPWPRLPVCATEKDRKEVSEGARAIPNKRQMKTLLKFMKKTHKVRAARTQRAKSFVYSLHPLYLRREQARGGGQAPSPG